jgi:hypothetical protein
MAASGMSRTASMPVGRPSALRSIARARTCARSRAVALSNTPAAPKAASSPTL